MSNIGFYVESLANFRQTLNDLAKQKKERQDELLKLKPTQVVRKGAVKKVIRQIERDLDDAERQYNKVLNEIRKFNKTDVDRILAEKGIDSRGERMKSWSGIASSTSSAVVAVAGALTGMPTGGNASNPLSSQTHSSNSRPVVSSPTQRNDVQSGGCAPVLILLLSIPSIIYYLIF